MDCKRVFCRQCSSELAECEVCHRPLCRHSRIVCAECGRGTYQTHQELCHVKDGEPVDVGMDRNRRRSPTPGKDEKPETGAR